MRTISKSKVKKTVKPVNGALLTICPLCAAWIFGEPDYCPECGKDLQA